jgi:hypothetical protein
MFWRHNDQWRRSANGSYMCANTARNFNAHTNNNFVFLILSSHFSRSHEEYPYKNSARIAKFLHLPIDTPTLFSNVTPSSSVYRCRRLERTLISPYERSIKPLSTPWMCMGDAKCSSKFHISLTVHLGTVLVNNQLDAISQCIYLFTSLHVSSSTVLIIRRSNCINTSSGMISVSGSTVCRTSISSSHTE